MFRRTRDLAARTFGDLFGGLVPFAMAFGLVSILLELPEFLTGARIGTLLEIDADAAYAGLRARLFGDSRMLENITLIVLALVMHAIAAIAWHRYLLVGERPSFFRFAIGGTHLRYLATMFGLIALYVLVVVVSGLVTWNSAVASGMLIVLLPVLLRASVMLPAVSLGGRLTLSGAFRRSRGYGVPMAATLLLIVLVLALLYLGVFVLAELILAAGYRVPAIVVMRTGESIIQSAGFALVLAMLGNVLAFSVAPADPQPQPAGRARVLSRERGGTGRDAGGPLRR